jgi:CRP/FNR family transcriptional regulator, cyclic AMP receptor protein
MQGYEQSFDSLQVLCRQGDPSSDIYLLKSGKLLACSVQGTKVVPLARISPGEFVGELSFFDGKPRASHVIALEPSQVIMIPKHELSNLLPSWYVHVGKNLTKKIRLLDGIVHGANLRRFGKEEDQKALTIEEQREVLKAITQQDS